VVIPQLASEEQAKAPFITAAQMREVDRLMVEYYGITLFQMMEHAGRHLAHLARVRFFDGNPRDRRVLVLAGTGGNGGGGLVCARRLHNWGANVEVWLAAAAFRLTEVTRRQLEILEKLRVPIKVASSGETFPPAALVLDALVGYSLRGAPTGLTAALVEAANRSEAPVLSLDIPTGVDATTGEVYEPAVQANATLTLALPKSGLRAPGARRRVGELYLGDIGVPPALYARPTLELDVGPLFAASDLIRIW